MSVSFGPYEVVERVAVGSTGTVFRARHVELDRVAAIKELSLGLREIPGFLVRFRGEAEILGGLDHPNIVAVYDYAEEPERTWIAEEWVSGASVEAILSAHGRLSPEQAVGVLRGSLMGLAHAHDRGLVHRDIAPGNILADMAGLSKRVDFGLAAPVGHAGAQGTPAFISPEAARGEPVGKSSDVYSAAAVLFMLLSGRPPFAAADPVRMLKCHVEDPAPALSGHGEDLQDLLHRSMDKDPSVRPPDAGAFLAELEEAARKRFGEGWLAKASIATLVAAATAGGVTVAGGASAGVAAGAPGAIVDVAATGAGALGAAAGAAPKTGLFGLSAVVAVGIAAAAVLVVGGGAFAAVKLAGASGGDGSGSKARSPAAVASARAAALKASAPIGIYTIRSVLVSSTYQGDKPGTVTEGTIGLSLKCDAKSCTGASQTGGGTQRWDGSELSLGGAPPKITSGLCVDKAGKPVTGSHFTATTTQVVSPLRPSKSTSSGPPRTFTGTADYKTTYTELKGNCQNRVDSSHYTVTLIRK